MGMPDQVGRGDVTVGGHERPTSQRLTACDEDADGPEPP
jgi:hypothetical protein